MNSRSAALSLAFANVGHLFTHLLMLLYPTVVLALEGRYGLSYGELLALSMPGFVLYGVMALPAGWLSDRWSAEYMIVIYFLGSGGAAIATGFADGPVGLAIGLTAIGLFGSIYHPVGVAWLVRNAENRGRVLGWNGIFGSLGVGVASFVAGGLTDLWSCAPPSSCRAPSARRSAWACSSWCAAGTWSRSRPTASRRPSPSGPTSAAPSSCSRSRCSAPASCGRC